MRDCVFAELFEVGRAAVGVDISAVRFGVQDMALGSKPLEQQLRGAACRAVGAVERDSHAVERIERGAFQVVDVVLDGVRGARDATDILGRRELWFGLLVEHDRLDALLELILELIAVLVEYFDSVVLVGVVRRGYHDARVRLVLADKVSDRRRGHDSEVDDVGSDRAESGSERGREHFRGNSRIHSDQHGRQIPPSARQHLRRRAPDLHCPLTRELGISDAAHAVCSE